MDVAGQRIGVPIFRTNLKLDGDGVVVGIVDTGIDGGHSAFQGRIHSVWDQIAKGNGVAEGGYGVEFTGASIGQSIDENGHGTHVAGISAGRDNTFGGVAPAATLVVVKSDLNDGRISDGIKYIFRVARDLGRPAVVNLSLGGHTDPHDGTDPLSLDIDDHSGPGRIVCCAAGNEGDDDIHAQVKMQADAPETLSFRIPSLRDPQTGKMFAPAVTLNGWYGSTDRIEVAVQTPGGISTPFQRILPSEDPHRTYNVPGARVSITTPGPNAENGDHQFRIDIQGPNGGGGPSTTGVWRLRLKPVKIQNGRIDVWVIDDSGGTAVTFRGAGIVDTCKIGSPGTAKRAITVASYTTKVSWKDQGGTTQAVEMAVDSVSSFSSEGPLRNGMLKPDVAAPGAMVVSALSSRSNPADAYRVSDMMRVNAGTSMACPFISGLVALLLQRNPAMTPEQARGVLQAAAAVPGGASGVFDPKWGRGVVGCSALEQVIGGA